MRYSVEASCSPTKIGERNYSLMLLSLVLIIDQRSYDVHSACGVDGNSCRPRPSVSN